MAETLGTVDENNSVVDSPNEFESLLPGDKAQSEECNDAASDNQSNESVEAYGSTILGMFLVALATFFFCTVGAIIQEFGGSITQLMLGRYILQHLIAWTFWICFKRYSESKIVGSLCPRWMTQSFRRNNNHNNNNNNNNGELLWYGNAPNRKSIWIRGALYWLLIFCWLRSLEIVSIGDAEAILFTTPVVTTIIARCWLNEPLSKTFIITLVLALSSVVLITQPEAIFQSNDGDSMPLLGGIYLLIAVFSSSMQALMVRKAKTAHWLQLELVSTFECAFLYTPLLIIICLIIETVENSNNSNYSIANDIISGGEWKWDIQTLLICVSTAIIGFFGLMCVVIGYQLGNATKVSFMMYFNLVVAFGYQIIWFEDFPNIYTIIGVCLLLASCLIHVVEECYSHH